MQTDGYMKLAIQAAQAAQKDGGIPIGAILVHTASGKVMATGESLVSATKDPTSHAEINCIRAACQQTGNDDLFDYTLYTTLEPCSMCLGAAAWARIANIYFGAYRKDVGPNLFDTIHPDDESMASHMNLRSDAQMHVQGGILQQQCAALLANYQDTPNPVR